MEHGDRRDSAKDPYPKSEAPSVRRAGTNATGLSTGRLIIVWRDPNAWSATPSRYSGRVGSAHASPRDSGASL